jgi:hypothetical protein
VLTLVGNLEQFMTLSLRSWLQYHVERADLITRVLSNTEDFERAINLLDAEASISCRACLTQLVSCYVALKDAVCDTRDMVEKGGTTAGENAANMYT